MAGKVQRGRAGTDIEDTKSEAMRAASGRSWRSRVLGLGLATALCVMASAAQRAAAQQAPSYFLEVSIPGRGILTQSSNIQLCKDRSYRMHVTARQENPYESLVQNTRIAVVGA